jgi:16S rRNA (guanine527-N7)-methyltransferase
MDRDEQISTFCRYYQVSRETFEILKKYESILIESNKMLNLVGKSTINQIWHRHILDSYQVIDYIDKNDKNLVDLGSGSGFPGIVLAIAANDKKIPIKITLIEKSLKKVKFLKDTIKKLKLEVKVDSINIFESKKKISGELFVARAFKPLPIILQLIHNNISNYNKFFVFLGKTGRDELLQATKIWDIEYKQSMSITSSDSILIEINKLKKK